MIRHVCSQAVICKLLFANFEFDFFPAIYFGKIQKGENKGDVLWRQTITSETGVLWKPPLALGTFLLMKLTIDCMKLTRQKNRPIRIVVDPERIDQ